MIEAVLPFPNIDPVLIHIYGPISIRWYALSYIAGLLLGWSYVVRLLRTPKLWAGKPFMGKIPATPDDIGDLFVWVTLGVIVGGRLGYVLLYGILYCGFAGHGAPACFGLPEAYFTDPIKIVAAWEGGMSFHGGLIGVVLAVILFCRSRKLNFLTISDLIAAATPIGLFFGRIANFINGELIGRPAPPDLPWAMIFPNGGPEPRHPSQLYEAGLEGLTLLLIMHLLWRVKSIRMRSGTLAGCFLLGYAAARIFAEFFREPDAFLGPVIGQATMGQVLSIPVAIAGLALIAWPRRGTA